MADTAPGQWVTTYAGEITNGDLIRKPLRTDERRVVDRTFTGLHSPIFKVWYGNGSFEHLAKTERIEVYDPDGTVAKRVMLIDR